MVPLTSAAVSEAELIARITLLEERKNALAAEQADTILTFARAHAASQTAVGWVEPEKLERSIAAQVGLACRVSPTEGRRRNAREMSGFGACLGLRQRSR